MSKVFELSGLQKKYKTFSLKNISFSIAKGSIVGFLGINGAGKTTTIKTMLGLTKGKYEKMEYFGVPFKGNEAKTKERIGVVLDGSHFYEHLKVKEMKNIVAPSYKNWDEAIYKKCLDKFRLDEKQKIAKMSKGMQMKLSLSFALAHHAELFILDEPTSGLDPFVRNEVIKMLKDICKNEGCSIFFSTHILEDVEKAADTLVMINNGKILICDKKDEVVNKYKELLHKDSVSVEDIMMYQLEKEGENADTIN